MVSLRGKILKTARNLFAKEGVEGISMRRVADRVGVTAPAIYRHFDNKNALVQAVVDEGFELLESYLRDASSDVAPRARLDALLTRYLDFAFDEPLYFDSMFLLPRDDARRFPEGFEQRQSETFNIFLDHVIACMASRAFRKDDPLETTLTVWAQAQGLVSIYRAGRFGRRQDRFRAVFGRSINRILDGISA